MLFLDISFDLLFQFLKFRSEFTTVSFFVFCLFVLFVCLFVFLFFVGVFFLLLFFFFFFFFFFVCLFCLCRFSFIPFSNLPSKLRCNPGDDGSYRSTQVVLEGIYLSTASCMKKIIKLKFSLTEREPEWPLKYLSFAQFEESGFIDQSHSSDTNKPYAVVSSLEE